MLVCDTGIYILYNVGHRIAAPVTALSEGGLVQTVGKRVWGGTKGMEGLAWP